MPRLITRELVMEALDFNEGVAGSLLDLFIDGAESIIERGAGRQFAPTTAADPTETRVFQAGTDQQIPVSDLRVVTAMDIDGVVLDAVEDYELVPNPVIYGDPATHVLLRQAVGSTISGTYGQLEISGKWGFSPTPADVKMATVVLASRFYRERDAGFSDQLITGEGIAFNYFRQLPASVQEVINRYRVMNFALIGI